MNNDYDTINLDPLITKLSEGLEELDYRFRNFAEEVQKQKINFDPVQKALYDAFGVEKSNTERPNTKYGNKPEFVYVDEWVGFDDTFARLKEELEKSEPIYDISWIRKRMKCCKNPMERKQLEKQLNAAYKARKKARKKNVP